MNYDFDVCVIGSGAGGGPIAYELSKAGYSVLVLEKGPWLTEKAFYKDEVAAARRNTYIPDPREEYHIVETDNVETDNVETDNDQGEWNSQSTYESHWNFWNGNLVGGSSNLMSGYFHRLKPVDFKLRSEFGEIAGANIVDWPIEYKDLEPYYTKVESIVGVSGRVVEHPFLEPRSTKDFPFPPLAEHPVSRWVDKACHSLGVHALPTPRAILSQPRRGRRSCEYSGYCGSYGCATGAKGSSRAALLDEAISTGRCHLQPNAMVSRLASDAKGRLVHVEYVDQNKQLKKMSAQIFVVACQAIETARLLLNSVGEKFPNGLANSSGAVGKNLLFAGGGEGSGSFYFNTLKDEEVDALKVQGPFINRALQDWYVIDDPLFGGRVKGGTVDIVHRHPAPIARATRMTQGQDGLVWGPRLKRRLEQHFTQARYLKVEAFCDWLPNDNCFVSLDKNNRDRWNLPVGKVRIAFHEHNLKVGWFLANKGADVLRAMGADDVIAFASGSPPTNLVAGTCRFGEDQKSTVLNADCRAHDVDNLYISDGSFMPTGGSVPYTFTIYANAFRVADKVIKALGGVRKGVDYNESAHYGTESNASEANRINALTLAESRSSG